MGEKGSPGLLLCHTVARGTWHLVVDRGAKKKKKEKEQMKGARVADSCYSFVLLNRQRERNKGTRKAGRGFMSCHGAVVCSRSRSVSRTLARLASWVT